MKPSLAVLNAEVREFDVEYLVSRSMGMSEGSESILTMRSLFLSTSGWIGARVFLAEFTPALEFRRSDFELDCIKL